MLAVMGDNGTNPIGIEQQDGWRYSEGGCLDIMDGRLSAIMPRKLFQDDAAVKSGLLQVYVRMKPVPDTTETCMILDHNQLLKATWRNKEAVYKFSKVFQTDADQEAVYVGTTASLVEDFLSFRQPSAVVMAYGVTSAGKTFTMQGTSDKPGLVPLALKGIFETLGSTSRKDDRVSLSVCEIYNESIHDLLAPPHQRLKPTALRLKEDKCGNITVVGAAQVPVNSAKEALELLRRAAKARQSAGTGVNEHSSRSHAVITVRLHTAAQEPMHDVPERQAFLHFVDLAGCERVKRTGNSGARLRESVAINSSLMTLARCLEVLRYNQQHPADQKVIPYRESKVTHLFKGVLHGNGRFVMVVNVSPASEAFNETKRVLQYAALASKVTMTSEIEHDIAGDSWPSAHNLPPEQAAQTSAADAAAAAAASAALSAAQARIEELLDDKADLEYEIDVVERKVELLREELIKSEVEKEQLEADIRAEVQEEMQQLIDQATTRARAKAAAAEQEAAHWQQKAAELQKLLGETTAQEQAKTLAAQQEAAKWQQKAVDAQLLLAEATARERAKTAAAAKEAAILEEKVGVLEQVVVQHAALVKQHAEQWSDHTQGEQKRLQEAKLAVIEDHRLLLQQAQDAAHAAAAQQDNKHAAELEQQTQQHQQQLTELQQQLSAAQSEAKALQQQQLAAAGAERQVAAAKQQVAELKQLVAGALQLLEQAVGQQHQDAANASDLAATAQQAQAMLVQRQQQSLGHHRQPVPVQSEQHAAADDSDEAAAATTSAGPPAAVGAAAGQQLDKMQEQRQTSNVVMHQASSAALQIPTSTDHTAAAVHTKSQGQGRPNRSRRTTMAGCPAGLHGVNSSLQQAPAAGVGSRRSRRQTMSVAMPAVQEELAQADPSADSSHPGVALGQAATAARRGRRQTTAAGLPVVQEVSDQVDVTVTADNSDPHVAADQAAAGEQQQPVQTITAGLTAVQEVSEKDAAMFGENMRGSQAGAAANESTDVAATSAAAGDARLVERAPASTTPAIQGPAEHSCAGVAQVIVAAAAGQAAAGDGKRRRRTLAPRSLTAGPPAELPAAAGTRRSSRRHSSNPSGCLHSAADVFADGQQSGSIPSAHKAGGVEHNRSQHEPAAAAAGQLNRRAVPGHLLGAIAEGSEDEQQHANQQHQQLQQDVQDHAAALVSAEQQVEEAAPGHATADADMQHMHTAPSRKRRRGCEQHDGNHSDLEQQQDAADDQQEAQQEQVQQQQQQDSNSAEQRDRRKRRKTVVALDKQQEPPQQQQLQPPQEQLQQQIQQQSNSMLATAAHNTEAMEADTTENKLQPGPDFVAGVVGGGKRVTSAGTSRARNAGKAAGAAATTTAAAKAKKRTKHRQQASNQQPEAETGLQQQQQVVEQQPDAQADTTDMAGVVSMPAAAGVQLKCRARKATSPAAAAAAEQQEEGWQSAECVLQDVTQQQLGLATGRRATYAAGAAMAAVQPRHKGRKAQPAAAPLADIAEAEQQEDSWQSAERVLRDVTRQQLGVAGGRRATYAVADKPTAAPAARLQGVAKQQAKAAATAAAITPVAFRTRHRGAK